MVVQPDGGIDELLLLFGDGAQADDERLLDALSATAQHLADNDLVHRLVPIADRLSRLDFSSHPWAALPGGVAICAIDRPKGRAVLSAARKTFEAEESGIAAGYAYFLEGLQDLGEGNLRGAQRWWKRARPLLGAGVASRLTSTHLALAMFFNGEVAKAVILGEEALWAAEHANDMRSEATACMDLALFNLTTGRMGVVEHHIKRGIAVLERLPPLDRYEMPVMLILDAALHTLRDERADAERGFTEALADAAQRGNRWYEAIAYAVRAEWTAAWNPARAIEDSRGALDYLDSIGEQWWSRSARIAYAMAHLHAGNLTAGQAACATLSELDLNDLDRGRALLVAARIAHQRGDPAATSLAQQGIDLLSACGANYLAAMGDMVLSVADPRRREFHRRRAEARAGADRHDPAWRSLLRGPGIVDIQILGRSEVRVDGVLVRFSTKAEVELVAMLALAPNGLDRETIGDRLWPADHEARVAHRVDNLVSSVRRQLAPTARIRRERGVVFLDLLDGECDARDFVKMARGELRGESIALDEASAISLIRRLDEPILGGRVAPWIGLAQHELAELASGLRRARGRQQAL